MYLLSVSYAHTYGWVHLSGLLSATLAGQQAERLAKHTAFGRGQRKVSLHLIWLHIKWWTVSKQQQSQPWRQPRQHSEAVHTAWRLWCYHATYPHLELCKALIGPQLSNSPWKQLFESVALLWETADNDSVVVSIALIGWSDLLLECSSVCVCVWVVCLGVGRLECVGWGGLRR